MVLRLVIFMSFFLSMAFIACGQDAKQVLNDKLFEATRAGNVAEVKSLLDQGADVNARFRYGATALFKAAERGHTDVVKLLLERGADVSVKDTFYGATAMTWALQNSRAEVVRVLLDKSAESVDEVLTTGASSNNVELVRVALAKGGAKSETLTDALVAVTSGEGKNDEIADMLRKAGAAPPIQIDAETLQSYVGKYKNEQGIEISITLKDNTLFGSQNGSPPFAFRAIDKITFKPVGFDGLALTFTIEGTNVNGLSVKQGQSTTLFKRVEEGK